MPARKRGTQGLMEGVCPAEGTAVDVGWLEPQGPRTPPTAARDREPSRTGCSMGRRWLGGLCLPRLTFAFRLHPCERPCAVAACPLLANVTNSKRLSKQGCRHVPCL